MHSFKTHFSSPSVCYINEPIAYSMCLLLLKIEQSAFTQALSGVHECPGSLQWPHLNSLSKQTASYESPHSWLMSLAMDLAVLCDMWR